MFAEQPHINTTVDGQKTPSTERKHPQSSTGSQNERVVVLNQPLREKLLDYKDRYRTTGQLDFIEFEIVAKMAKEGPVLVPDHAQKKVQRIRSCADKVIEMAFKLQSTLSDSTAHEGRKETARRELLTLYRANTLLVATVDQHVIPLAGIVSVEKKQDIEGWIQSANDLLSTSLKQFEAIIGATEHQPSDIATSIIQKLTQLAGNVDQLSTTSVGIIEARVPFYRLEK